MLSQIIHVQQAEPAEEEHGVAFQMEQVPEHVNMAVRPRNIGLNAPTRVKVLNHPPKFIAVHLFPLRVLLVFVQVELTQNRKVELANKLRSVETHHHIVMSSRPQHLTPQQLPQIHAL